MNLKNDFLKIKALGEKIYRVKLVHGNKGWMAVGMTFMTVTGLGSAIINTTTANASAVNNVAVTNVRTNGTVQLYKDVDKSNIGVVSNRALANNTAWKTARAIKGIDGETYLLIGGNEYANTKNMDLSDEISKQTLNGVIVTGDRLFTRLYTNPIDSAKTVTNRGLARNTEWKIINRVVVSGVSYYQVSTNEWVKSSDVNLNNETSRSEKTYLAGAPDADKIDNNGGGSSSRVKPVVEKANVTIKAVDEKGQPIGKDEIVKDQVVGTDYEAKAPTIEGYTLTDKATQTVKVDKSGSVVTFKYEKNAPVVEKANVTIKAVDEKGQPIGKDEIVKDQVVGTDYKAKAPTIEGYTLTDKATQTIKVDKSGSVVTFKYEKQALVIVRYIDESGNELVPNDQFFVDKGSIIGRDAKSIEGYIIDGKIHQNEIIDGDKTITFKYKQETH